MLAGPPYPECPPSSAAEAWVVAPPLPGSLCGLDSLPTLSELWVLHCEMGLLGASNEAVQPRHCCGRDILPNSAFTGFVN